MNLGDCCLCFYFRQEKCEWHTLAGFQEAGEGPVSLKVIAKCISADFAFFTKYFKGHLGKSLIFHE